MLSTGTTCTGASSTGTGTGTGTSCTVTGTGTGTSSTGTGPRRQSTGYNSGSHRNGCVSVEHNTFWNPIIFANQ